MRKANKLFSRVRLLEMNLRVASRDLLEACDWVQLPNGAWMRRVDYEDSAEVMRENDRLPPGSRKMVETPEHLFLTTAEAVKICMYHLAVDRLKPPQKRSSKRKS